MAIHIGELRSELDLLDGEVLLQGEGFERLAEALYTRIRARLDEEDRAERRRRELVGLRSSRRFGRGGR